MLTYRAYAKLCRDVMRDPARFMARALFIETKRLAGQPPVTKLVLNTPQRKVHDVLIEMRREGRPPRVITLKSRQPGVSTLAAGWNMSTLIFQPYAKTITVAHLEKTAEQIFRKIKFMHERLPAELRPHAKIFRKNEVAFDSFPCQEGATPLYTTGLIGTAAGSELWRGLTIHGCHLTECALYKNDREVFLGVMQAVPKSPDSYIILESTANGMGNSFHETWIAAETGKSTFRPVFIAWYEIAENVAALPPGFKLTSEERDLKRQYDLTDNQIQWWREILFECGGDEALRDQEHPTTAAESFLTSGRPYFPIDQLRKMHEKARTRKGKVGVITDAFQFIPESSGLVRIWALPVPDHEYIIGADPSGGEEDGDPSGVAVLDRNTEEIVATIREPLGPLELATELMRLGYFYNTAMLNIELNAGWGNACLTECRQKQYPYYYVWHRWDRVKSASMPVLCWQTSWKTKPTLLAGLRSALLHNEIMIWDPEAVMELMAVRHLSVGMAEGEKNDDLPIAVMLTWVGHVEMALQSTGLPPRMAFPSPQAPEVADQNAHLSPSHRAVWDEADRAMEQAQRGQGPLANPADFVEPDPDGTFPPPEGEEPPGGWY